MFEHIKDKKLLAERKELRDKLNSLSEKEKFDVRIACIEALDMAGRNCYVEKEWSRNK